ncbi:MAG: hypothetical protein LH473_00035 [Chitinophagales bacterium]|nr:hypothetical protein [Chitinophagales bacterium]
MKKNNKLILGMVAGGAAALTIAIISSPPLRKKISKMSRGVADTLLNGINHLYDLTEKEHPKEQSEPNVNEVNYKTHGHVNEEKSVHASTY